MHQLLLARIKPYYLYMADLTKGTNHFRTTVETGLKDHAITSGPHEWHGGSTFCDRRPWRWWKNSIIAERVSIRIWMKRGAVLKNFENKTYHYPQPGTQDNRELPMVNSSMTRDMCSTGAIDDH